jgi:hypothetical protein
MPRIPYSDGRNNNFFQDTSVARQPTAYAKGNLQGKAEKRKSTIDPTRGSKFFQKQGFVYPNQGVTDGPPKSANWQSTGAFGRTANRPLHGKHR